ncbi:MAG: DVUA0089 family protein [Pseudomonadota bacterium]
MSFKTGIGVAVALIAISAAPALAQSTEICPSLGTGAVWIGGDEASSDVMTAQAPLDQSGVTVPPSGNVLQAFTVSTPGQVRVEALPQFGGDTVIELYTTEGTLVLTDDDSGGNFASRGEVQLDAGTYCLLTRSFGGGPLVTDLRVARAEMEALTDGWSGGADYFSGVEACLPTTPATLLGQGPIDGQLSAGVSQTNTTQAVPYYRFSLASPQALTITAENEWADPYIYIFDGQGNLIAENDDYNGFDSQIDFTQSLPPGDYCIGMRALSDPNQPVTLSVLGYDPQRALFQLYASGEASPPPGSGYPITELGVLQSRLVYDQPVGADAVWYSFSVPAGGLVLINAVEISDSDPRITLFDGAGRMLEFNDDAGATLDSRIATPVGPGNYMLGVMQYSQGYNGIIRVSIERYVPAQ